MRKFKRLTLTLALLLTAVGGAWADETLLLTIENKDYPSFKSGSQTFDDMVTVTFSNPVYNDGDSYGWYANSPSLLTVAGINGYTITSCKFYTGYGIAADGYTVAGESPSVYLLGAGVYKDDSQSEYLGSSGVKKIEVYGSEPEPTEWSLTPDETGKTWTLDKMPASNIELQVEYEPTKVTMAANDNAMGTVEVASGSKVEWTADTWKGWNYDTKEYTVGDITMTSSKKAYIRETTEEGDYKNSLSIGVLYVSDESTVTFSTTGDPFSRIEFTMIDDYDEDNPHILPLDNWTFSGKSAVWEGEATKSLTLQSCSTQVSKITFYQGAGIPDGVTVNGDGTFTVAKTATVTLKATPAEGYKFLYWEDDQTNTNPVREVTIESGMADMTYKAVFAEILYNVTFADGIEDADKWKAEPNTAAKNTEIKVTYSGAKKVIGVKAEKKSEAGIVNPVVGQIIGSDGKNYDANATLPSGVTAVAKIAYVGNDAETSTTYNHGLALALGDVSDKKAWCSQYQKTCLTTQYGSADAAKGDMAGIANTDALVNHTGHSHAAASAARDYNGGTHPMGTSEWFLPSAGQWDKMASAAGGYVKLRTNAGLQSDYYWSSTERDASYAWYFSSHNGDWLKDYKDMYSHRVRACLAF